MVENETNLVTEAQEPQLGTMEAVAGWVGIVTRDVYDAD